MPRYRVELGGSYYGGENDERIKWDDEVVIEAENEEAAAEIAARKSRWPTSPDWTMSELLED